MHVCVRMCKNRDSMLVTPPFEPPSLGRLRLVSPPIMGPVRIAVGGGGMAWVCAGGGTSGRLLRVEQGARATRPEVRRGSPKNQMPDSASQRAWVCKIASLQPALWGSRSWRSRAEPSPDVSPNSGLSEAELGQNVGRTALRMSGLLVRPLSSTS